MLSPRYLPRCLRLAYAIFLLSFPSYSLKKRLRCLHWGRRENLLIETHYQGCATLSSWKNLESGLTGVIHKMERAKENRRKLIVRRRTYRYWYCSENLGKWTTYSWRIWSWVVYTRSLLSLVSSLAFYESSRESVSRVSSCFVHVSLLASISNYHLSSPLASIGLAGIMAADSRVRIRLWIRI